VGVLGYLRSRSRLPLVDQADEFAQKRCSTLEARHGLSIARGHDLFP
jgi:hypothetical protein